MRQPRPKTPISQNDPDETQRPGPGAPPSPPVAPLPFLAPPLGPGELGRLGPYRVLKVLGSGSMGIVLKAEDPDLGRTVALKVMLPELAARPDMRERFLREGRIVAALRHDHILSIFHVGEDRGVPYLVMPLLRGMTVHEYLRQGRQLSLGQVVRVAKDVARGLQAAHERGLIHRDIKPANLWVDSAAGGRIKILDFGLARPMNADNNLTSTGVVLGTPAYMAPEQINGQAEPRSDLYSLGAVLYRLLTRRLPFQQEDAFELMLAVATETPPHICELAPTVPEDFANLVMRLLAKRLEKRPASAQEFLEEVKKLNRDVYRSPNPVQRIAAPVDDGTELIEASDEDSAANESPTPQPHQPRIGWLLVILAAVAVTLLSWLVILLVMLLPR